MSVYRVEGVINERQVWASETPKGEIRWVKNWREASIFNASEAELLLRNFPCAKAKHPCAQGVSNVLVENGRPEVQVHGGSEDNLLHPPRKPESRLARRLSFLGGLDGYNPYPEDYVRGDQVDRDTERTIGIKREEE